MSDNKDIDDIMNRIKITSNSAAKEKAKAAFLLKADEVTENEKESKHRILKNKHLIYSFLTGMAAMLVLVVGTQVMLNTEFLSGAVRTTSYYEINSPYVPFKNGDELSADTLQQMKASGNKFKLYMENGLALYIDTVGNGPVSLNYNLTPDTALAELFQSAAGGSIITLKVEDGFTEMPVKYEIDLTAGALAGMTASEQQKWLSGLYVYCYVVDQNQLAQYMETGQGENIVSKERMLTAKIDGQSLYVNTNPDLFDIDKDMLMFMLNELDSGTLDK
ncbi:MAG: hypothetical protein AB7V48_05390 [Sedimentibacter sp.]